jgi:hypothetical protein
VQSRFKSTVRGVVIRAASIRGVGMAVAMVWTATIAILVVASAGAAADDAAPRVALDDLLQLPPSLEFEPAGKGRFTKAEWRERFDTARAEFAAAQADLAATQAKIAKAAGETSAWKMAAPGLGGADPGSVSDGPVDYSLSAAKRRNQEEVARADRRLGELEIEANLANVPADWRGTQPPAADAGVQPPEAEDSSPIQARARDKNANAGSASPAVSPK